MVNRERFMLDCDSEGFTDPAPNPPSGAGPLAGINVGKLPDVELAHALLTDERCLRCPPSEQCPRSGYCEQRNPEGWREIDGVKLPLISWAEGQREKGDILRSIQDCANINHDGITRLSDSYAPDAYFGHKK